MVEDIAFLFAGVFVWTILEYLIHGWLSHTFHTFATPLHAVHHGDAHAVFTIRAWIPIALVWTILVLLLGWTPWVILFNGAMAGFAGYETIHYRIHFRQPRGAVEQYLRARHLVHHNYYPNRCFGVTSALWDLVFGTEPMGAAMTALCKSTQSIRPLSGRTNLSKIQDSVLPFSLIRHLSRHLRT
jgi:dihydroceramide fatty acyl 2-hydroxylase